MQKNVDKDDWNTRYGSQNEIAMAIKIKFSIVSSFFLFVVNGVTFSRLMLWAVPSMACIVNGLALKSDVEVISVQSLVSHIEQNSSNVNHFSRCCFHCKVGCKQILCFSYELYRVALCNLVLALNPTSAYNA